MTIPPLLTAAALNIWPTVAVLVGFAAAATILIVLAGSRMLRR